MEQLTKNKIDEILARKPESRYKYFIRTVAELEEVWGMADDEGWMMLEDDLDNTDVLPVFPHREFAELFYEQGEFGEAYKVEPLDLYEFMEWLEDMAEQKIKVGVFPTPDFECAVMTPEKVMADLQTEFDKETE